MKAQVNISITIIISSIIYDHDADLIPRVGSPPMFVCHAATASIT